MKRHGTHYALALVLFGLLSACASSPASQYYLLEADTGDSNSSDFAARAGTLSLGVGPIGIPPYLGRDNLVYRLQDSELQVAAYHKWAEPLEDGVSRVLMLHLARGLDTQTLRRFPWHPSRAPDIAVTVDILELELGATEASLTAQWLVYRPGTDASVAGRVTTVYADLAGSMPLPEGVPAAYGVLLRRLADVILAAMRPDGEGAAG